MTKNWLSSYMFVKPGIFSRHRMENESYSPTFLPSMQNSTSPGLHTLPITETSSTADSCSHKARVRENRHLRTKPTIGKNPVNGPALDIIWKGNIEIHDCPPNLGFCEGVLAHPSTKVARKAYSFSKEISGNLHFVMYSLDQLCPDIFKTHCPDRDDIALYFYPGNYERSKHQYSSLLKFMKRKGLMLRSRMGSVELLVYPSSLLPVDSQQLGNCYFMWGVFRHLKEDTSSSNAGGAQYNSTSRPELK